MVIAAMALAGRAHAQAAPDRLDVAAYQTQAAALFSPEALMADPRFAPACDGALLLFQSLSVLVIVAGMIVRMRNDHEQMEGLASVLIKVAFIATIPFWRGFVLESAGLVSEAIGHRSACSVDPPSASVTAMWNLLGQWAPSGSPALDSLETQGGAPPVSGDEADWSWRAWNWASGLAGAAGGQSGWQALAGGFRGTVVLTCCGGVTALVAFTLALTYFVEAFRLLLFQVGCAMLPVFIAGLAVDSLRSQCLRFVIGLVSLAFWPVGWGIASVATTWLGEAMLRWMRDLCAAAAGVNVSGSVVPPLALCAPNLAWGVLFLLAGLTVAVCVWAVASLFLVPLLAGRLNALGGQAVRGFAMAGSPGHSAPPAPSGRAAALSLTTVAGRSAFAAVRADGAGKARSMSVSSAEAVPESRGLLRSPSLALRLRGRPRTAPKYSGRAPPL